MLRARDDHVLGACNVLELALHTARLVRRPHVLEAKLGRKERAVGREGVRIDVDHAWASMVDLKRPLWAHFWLRAALLEQSMP